MSVAVCWSRREDPRPPHLVINQCTRDQHLLRPRSCRPVALPYAHRVIIARRRQRSPSRAHQAASERCRVSHLWPAHRPVILARWHRFVLQATCALLGVQIPLPSLAAGRRRPSSSPSLSSQTHFGWPMSMAMPSPGASFPMPASLLPRSAPQEARRRHAWTLATTLSAGRVHA